MNDENCLTVEQAQSIINVFGPCTHLYECVSPEELVERFNEDYKGEQVSYLLKICLAVEGAGAEKMDDTGECYKEWKAARPAVVERLRALGYTVE